MKSTLPDIGALPKKIENVQCWMTVGDEAPKLVDSTSNLVVYDAQEMIVSAIVSSLTGQTDGFITKYKAGATVNPKAPASDDKGLEDQNPFEKNFIKSNITISGSQISFSLIMEKGEGNANSGVKDYTELALMSTNNKMFARVLTTAPIPKDPNIRLEWKWTVGY
ncbi:hypothetical protein [Vibrio phage Va2]|nr:hypothetical protein [Vibrio phage Va2]